MPPARLFRERGIKDVSVSELMAAAGLTHGGFYGHFESKDASAAGACRSVFEQSAGRWKKRVAEDSGNPKTIAPIQELTCWPKSLPDGSIAEAFITPGL